MGTSESLPVALQTYFEHLENGEFEAAAGQFTEDCVYLHPPSYQSEVRVKGRAELVEYFANARGKQELNHEIIRSLVGDNQVAFIGYQTGDDTGDDYFISFAELEDGKISYYIAGFLKGETVNW